MAMTFSGAVLSGIGSSFHSGGAKLSDVGAVRVGKKTELVIVAQRKKSLIYAVKGDGNILDDLNEATKKASDFVTQKTKEGLKDDEKARENLVEKTVEAKDAAVEEAQKASEYVTDKTKEALKDGEKVKDNIVEKTVEAKDTAVEEAQKASEYVTEKGKEAGNKAAEFVEGKAEELKAATNP